MSGVLMTAGELASRLGLADARTVTGWRLHVCGRRGRAYLYSLADAEEFWAARRKRRRLRPWERTEGKRMPRGARKGMQG